jgi:hypothetical protein
MDTHPGQACQGCVRVQGDEGIGLHEEGVQRMLEGGDGTVGFGEGGLEVGEDLGGGPVRGFGGQFGQLLGGWAQPQQCGADLALGLVEALADAPQGPVRQLAFGGTDSSDHAAGDGTLEEAPQGTGDQTEAADSVGKPDAESASAAATFMAIAAEDAAGADGFSPRTAVVEAVQRAVANQSADDLAVGTGRQLEPLNRRVPFLVAATKPTLLAHARPLLSRKIVILPGWGERGVEAGYDKDPGAGCGVKIPGQATRLRQSRLPNSRCNKHPQIG